MPFFNSPPRVRPARRSSAGPAAPAAIRIIIRFAFNHGGKKINLKFIFPSEKLRETKALADISCADFSRGKIWRSFQDEVRNFFAQHPEVTL